MITLTKQNVISLLERAVEEKGKDYIYSPPNESWSPGQCAYKNKDGSPSCIIGHVFSYLGLLDKLVEGCSISEQMTVSQKLREVVFADTSTGNMLNYAQVMQDGGSTWGLVLECARDMAEEE